MTWTEQGKFDQAIADITQAVTIDPKYAFWFWPKGAGILQEEVDHEKDGWGRSGN
jgi:hypothetical protein